MLNSTSIMELDELPEHLIIVGGLYIGLEFGQFRRFGSEVTIIQRAARLMTREDEDVSYGVAAILRDDGITFLTSTTAATPRPAPGAAAPGAPLPARQRVATAPSTEPDPPPAGDAA